MALLSIQNLSKVYQDGNVALDGFNWELNDGVHGLLGPNGAGKSTLLEILSMNLMPASGKVLWEGQDIQKKPGRFRKMLGYLPQTYGFYPELKATQILTYLGRLHGLRGRALRHRIGEVLELVHLTADRKRKSKTYSGGMRQRLAIAQALLHKPRLLVIDEPTTGLDPGERVAFRNMLFDIGRQCVVLLSTHIVKDVEFSCHEMTLLYGGVQRFTGQPAAFMGRADGRVFQINVPVGQFEEFSRERHVVAIRELTGEIETRFIVPELPPDGLLPDLPDARPVQVNLEDTYVDFIRQHQQNEKREEEKEECDEETL